MPITITGDASQVTTPLTRTISAATNASPIVITTTASHLFASADRVAISGVGGNTAANGVWTITKISSTTFSLNGSTGNGAYTSGGTAVNRSLTPQFTIPNDGDQFDGASIAVPFGALADRTQYLAALALDKRAGKTDTLASTVTVDGTITASASGKIAASAAGAKIRTETGGRIELADDDYPTLASGHSGRTVTRLVTDNPKITSAKTANTSVSTYTIDASALTTAPGVTTFAAVDTADSTAAKAAIFYLDSVVPDGATITSVSATLQGASHSALPARMPKLRVQTAAGYPLHSSGSNVTDSSANTSAYSTPHLLSATCDQNNIVAKSTDRYIVSISNEGGANAVSGLTISSLTVTFTITDLRTF